MQDMISQVQAHIAQDWYIRRAARYDVRAIAAVLTRDHAGRALAEIDEDAVWDVMDGHVICRHDPVSGMATVDLEDLAEVAQVRHEAKLAPVECGNCEAWFSHDAQMWVNP